MEPKEIILEIAKRKFKEKNIEIIPWDIMIDAIIEYVDDMPKKYKEI